MSGARAPLGAARTAAGERSRLAREQRSAATRSPRSRTRPGPTTDGRSPRWRIIIIPILVVLTIVVLFQVNSEPVNSVAPAQPPASSPARSSAPVTGPQSTPATTAEPAAPAADPAVASAPPGPAVVPDPNNHDTEGHVAAAIAVGALPAGSDFAVSGTGTFHMVPGTSPMVGTGGQHSTYMIEVEDGISSPELDQVFAAEVDAVLADPRSWIGGGTFSLARVDTGDPDIRISLTSQMTVRGSCGWSVPLEASCFNGSAGRVFLNDARWVRGAMSFNGDLAAYRSYAVNHEVGHALGMSHQPCAGAGALAPVMMQQSWSTSNDDLGLLDPQRIPRDGNVCVANPYPFPDAVPPTPPPSAAAG